MTYCRLASMVFEKAGRRGIVWHCLQRIYRLQNSFERKQQTVAAFIDISGAYHNVLIDILCYILREKEVPLQVVRFLFRLLWRKELVFFAGGRECMTLVGYKGLPQGSVLSPFLYNIIKSCVDRFIPSGCAHAGFGKGSIPGIEDCIGSDEIYTE
jgi:hypothetical protein